MLRIAREMNPSGAGCLPLRSIEIADVVGKWEHANSHLVCAQMHSISLVRESITDFADPMPNWNFKEFVEGF